MVSKFHTIEGLSHLQIHDDHLIYKARRIDFESVRSVQFTATQTRVSVNFIPTGTYYKSELYLVLTNGSRQHIRQEHSFRSKTQKRKMEAVWQAAEIISVATFNRRLDRYEQSLTNKGFVEIGSYQVTNDGGVFKTRERLFGLRDADVKTSLGPFQLYIERQRHGLARLLGSQHHIVPIDIDRDCILYVLKRHLGISFPGVHVRERTVDRRRVFFTAVLRLAAKLAKADGQVSRDEIIAFKSVFRVEDAGIDDAAQIFAAAVRSADSIDDIAANVFSTIGDNQEMLEYIVVGLLQVAEADGVVHSEEINVIHRVCDSFGFSDEKTLSLLAMFGIDETDDDDGSANSTADAMRIQRLRVLGLGARATHEEIKFAYRQLVRQHHPDLLRAKGVPIDEMRRAEEILKRINEAYGNLTRSS